jgi:hypothetical protein
MKLVEERKAKAAENSNWTTTIRQDDGPPCHLGPDRRQYGGNLVAMNAAGRPLYGCRVIHPEQSARMRQSTTCRQIVEVDGIQERL